MKHHIPKEENKVSPITTLPDHDRFAKHNKKHEELDERLTAIYKNETGEIPDMQHIEIRRSHFWLKALVCFLFLIILGSGGTWAYFFLINPSSEDQAPNVSLSITGPSLTDFGAPVSYTISFSNRSSQALTKSTLTLRLPTGFLLTKSSLPAKNAAQNEWDVGTIEPGERRTFTITGLLYGGNRETRSWRAFLTYQGASLNSEVQESASFESTIVNSPYSLRIDGPATIAPGMDAAYTFTVQTNELTFGTDLELAPTWPENFALISSTPALSKTLRWSIPKKTASTTVQFTLYGRFSTSVEKSLPIKSNLVAIFPETNQSLTVSSASVITEEIEGSENGLALAINGSGSEAISASPGDMLTMTLSVKNTTASLIKDGNLRLIFQAPSIKNQSILTWAKLSDKLDGDLRGEQISAAIRQAVLTWNKKQLPALSNFAPGDEITLSINVPIKNTSAFDLASIKERVISITGGLSFTNVSGASQLIPLSRHLVTLTSDLSFENRTASSVDPVGKEVHTVTWFLSHSFGGLKNVKVSAEVFPNVIFAHTSPAAAGVATYDPTSKRLTWVIPEIPESVDVLAWSFSLTLPDKNPSQNTLLSKVTVQAEDQNGQLITRETSVTALASP